MQKSFKLKILICIYASMRLISQGAFADEVVLEALNLGQALSLAEQYNPQIIAAEKGLEVSRSDIQIAGERPNPQLYGYYGFGKTTTVLANPQQFGLTQTIETDGKRKKRVLVARAQYQVSSEQLADLRWDIRNQVRQAYIDMIAAEANLKAIDDQAKLLQDLVDIADKRVKAGAASEVERLQANLAKKQVDSLRFQANSQLGQARIHLNALLGNHLLANFTTSYHDFFNPSSGDVKLFPSLKKTLPPVDVLINKAFESRADLKMALGQLSVSEKQLSLARAQKVPNIELGAGGLFLGGPFLNVPAEYSPTGKKKDFFGGGYTSVNISLPVLNQYKGEVAKARATFEQSRLQITTLRVQIKDEVERAVVALDSSKQSIQNYTSQLLPAASEVVILAQKSYLYGKSGLANVIFAQQSERQIQQGYLEEIARYQRAWANLEKACGQELQL